LLESRLAALANYYWPALPDRRECVASQDISPVSSPTRPRRCSARTEESRHRRRRAEGLGCKDSQPSTGADLEPPQEAAGRSRRASLKEVPPPQSRSAGAAHTERALLEDVGVAHRGVELTMAEEFLHGAHASSCASLLPASPAPTVCPFRFPWWTVRTPKRPRLHWTIAATPLSLTVFHSVVEEPVEKVERRARLAAAGDPNHAENRGHAWRPRADSNSRHAV
jgi:hypothetical protein